MYNMFPTGVYKQQANLTDHHKNEMRDYLLAEFSQLPKSNHSLEDGGKTLFASNAGLHLSPIFKPLVSEIIFHIEEYWDTMLFTEATDPKILDMWANLHDKDDSTTLHSHSNIITVGCYYLNFPINSGNLIFKNPNEYTYHYYPFDYEGKEKYMWNEIDIVENDIVLFPGHLKHKTGPNMSNDTRISINFNVVMVDRQPEIYFEQ